MEMQELKQILETLKKGDGHFFKKQYKKDGFTISISNFFVGERYEVTVWWTVTTKKTYLSDTKKLLHSEVVNDSQTFHVPLQKKKWLGLIPQNKYSVEKELLGVINDIEKSFVGRLLSCDEWYFEMNKGAKKVVEGGRRFEFSVENVNQQLTYMRMALSLPYEKSI